MSDYVPIPVLAAKRIAELYARDIVIISAWSHKHALLHTTTYGVSPRDKISAAQGGEIAASALGMELRESDVSEDFRKAHNAAREAAMAEAIEKWLPILKHMAARIIAPNFSTLWVMADEFEQAARREP